MNRKGPGKFIGLAAFIGFAALLGAISGCGGSTSSATTDSGTSSNNTNPVTPVSNVQEITVNNGPALGVGVADVNMAFTSVTVCVPGSTTECQTIGGILVDTGSSGLRVLSSALTVALPQQNDSSGNPIGECGEFVDSETWGPVQIADVSMAGEKASSVPFQVVGSSSFAAVPSSCSHLGPTTDDLADLGANGILGIGNYIQDCGQACAVSGAQNAGLYYSCPASGCRVTAEAVASQVANPVSSFATDNNGVIVELPAASGVEASLTGSLIFGIGTQSDNAMGSQTVYTIDPDTGNFSTTYAGQTYTNASYLDTGSNAIYFLTPSTAGMPACADYNFWYCPADTQNFSAVNKGANGSTGTINFSIGNADNLLANYNNGVAVDLGGPNAGSFDWGLPFFYGRNVYTAIEGKSTPAGTGPYWAF